jgi:tryptophan synthase alpha chain
LSRARIEARFARLKAQGRAGFIPYIMAGDPDALATARILEALPDAGADLIELGVPFSDPMAEGPPIQRAAQRALLGGMTVRKVFGLVRAFRDADAETPIILMGYLNNVLALGETRFAAEAAEAGVDGLIVVDCPPEEAGPLADALEAHDLALIRLATPTTDAPRLAVIAKRTSGFVYYVSVAGTTGAKEADAATVAPEVVKVRAATGLPVAVGFGIKTAERASAIARVADAAVVGSALVDAGADAVSKGADPVAAVLTLVRALAGAVRTARSKEAA